MILALHLTHTPKKSLETPKIMPTNKEMVFLFTCRGILAGSNLLMFYSAMKLVPLSTFLVLRNLKGIFVLLLTPLFLNEGLSCLEIFLIFVSFVGTALIVNPWMFINFFSSLFWSSKVDIFYNNSKPFQANRGNKL